MKKIVILISIILLCGCSKSIFSPDQIQLEMVPNSLSSKGIKYVLKNNSVYECDYGAGIKLEHYVDNDWKPLETINDYNVIAIAYTLHSGEQKNLETLFEYVWGELKPGKYRLIKDIDCSPKEYHNNYDELANDYSDGFKDIQEVVAILEFEIEIKKLTIK